MAIQGKATPEGTRAFTERFPGIPPGHWREFEGLKLSSIGMGTYLGPHTAEGDRSYAEAVRTALRNGCNVLDTAINYRCQRSERSIQRALQAHLEEESVSREELLLCTKGGFLPFDGEPPSDASAYFTRTFIRSGIARSEQIAAGCHCMAPDYLRNQIEASLNNLGVDTIDVYYLHNPETQLAEVPRKVFEERLEEAFRVLEESAKRGRIQFYGLATWDGPRLPPDHPSHLSLSRMVEIARSVAGEEHRLRVLQTPFNLRMLEAHVGPTQELPSGRVPVFRAAKELGLTVFTSVPLLQARLIGALPKEAHDLFPGLHTDAQRAIQFVRSTPGVTAPLVGMGRPEHAEENLKTAKKNPLPPEAYEKIFA